MFIPPPNNSTCREENDEYWRQRARNPNDPYHHLMKARQARWEKEGQPHGD